MTPIFSIIIPTYNRANLISVAIDSCIAQSHADWELIIVDNASTDNTSEVVEAYSDNRIKYHFTKTQGRSAARNHGLNLAVGEWICFLDSDDAYTTDHLQALHKSIKHHPTISIHKTGVTIKNKVGIPVESSEFYENRSSFSSFICHHYASIMEVAVRASLAKKYQFADIEYWEDKHYLLLISKNETVHQLPIRTVLALQHEGRSINKAILNTKDINNTLQTMAQHFGNFKNADAAFVRDNFISTLIANGFLSGMSLLDVLKTLKNIQTKSTPYYVLKAILYKIRFK